MSPLLMESFLSLSGSIINSPEFNPDTCGVWQDFFAEPKTKKIGGTIRKNSSSSDPCFQKADRRRNTGSLHQKALAAAKALHSRKECKLPRAQHWLPSFLIHLQRLSQEQVAEDALFDLASRLSFFLWSSLPDDELIELAASGDLSKLEVFEQTINRMMNDKRVLRFCDSFTAQWLQLTKIRSAAPIRK